MSELADLPNKKGSKPVRKVKPQEAKTTQELASLLINPLTRQLFLDYNNQKLGAKSILLIAGAIEVASDSLSRLSLYLSQSELNDKCMSAVSKSISKCSKLTYLSLALNQIKLNNSSIGLLCNIFTRLSSTLTSINLFIYACEMENPDKIFEALSQCTKCTLLTLVVGGNILTDEQAKSLGKIFTGMPDLQVCDLNFTSGTLNETSSVCFFNELKAASPKALTRLKIMMNLCFIDVSGAHALAEAIPCIEQLADLDLNMESSRQGDPGLIAISESFLKCKKLTTCKFSIYYNFLETIRGEESIANIIGSHETLKSFGLGISLPKFGEDEGNMFAKSIQSNTNLQHFSLGLQCREILHENFGIFLNSFSATKNLLSINLQLSNCAIQLAGAQLLNQALTKAEQLEWIRLNLDRTQITNQGAILISEIIPKLEKLTYFSVSLMENEIDNEGAICFGSAIAKSKSLIDVILDFKYNKIGMNSPKFIAEEVVKCETLRQFSINLLACNIYNIGANGLIDSLKKANQLQSIRINLDNILEFKVSSFNKLRKNLRQLVSLKISNFNFYFQF